MMGERSSKSESKPTVVWRNKPVYSMEHLVRRKLEEFKTGEKSPIVDAATSKRNKLVRILKSTRRDIDLVLSKSPVSLFKTDLQ